ncbi:cilia- and flagella-associated protein 251-like [Engraulis encrasicolus]|uniref:cilia- and flagella-associated protein 251-like n=1 Tax=Engraulis encrasicolus TaxID=184585 RepID=UPI002FD2FBCF
MSEGEHSARATVDELDSSAEVLEEHFMEHLPSSDINMSDGENSAVGLQKLEEQEGSVDKDLDEQLVEHLGASDRNRPMCDGEKFDRAKLEEQDSSVNKDRDEHFMAHRPMAASARNMSESVNFKGAKLLDELDSCSDDEIDEILEAIEAEIRRLQDPLKWQKEDPGINEEEEMELVPVRAKLEQLDSPVLDEHVNVLELEVEKRTDLLEEEEEEEEERELDPVRANLEWDSPGLHGHFSALELEVERRKDLLEEEQEEDLESEGEEEEEEPDPFREKQELLEEKEDEDDQRILEEPLEEQKEDQVIIEEEREPNPVRAKPTELHSPVLDEHFNALEAERRHLQDLLDEKEDEHDRRQLEEDMEHHHKLAEIKMKISEKKTKTKMKIPECKAAMACMAVRSKKMRKELKIKLGVRLTPALPAYEWLDERIRIAKLKELGKALLGSKSAEIERMICQKCRHGYGGQIAHQKTQEEAQMEAQEKEEEAGKAGGETLEADRTRAVAAAAEKQDV